MAVHLRMAKNTKLLMSQVKVRQWATTLEETHDSQVGKVTHSLDVSFCSQAPWSLFDESMWPWQLGWKLLTGPKHSLFLT